MDESNVKKQNWFLRVLNRILDSFTNAFNRLSKAIRNPNSLFYYVVILTIVGILFYFYSLFTQFWTTSFGGDYTQQQIPFFYNGYDDWWTFFKTGKFPMWDENTFLGADNIGSNSFYYLFNPFFFATLAFPRSWIPQIMAIESIFKIVVAGLLMRLYLKFMGCSESTSRIFGVAYGVCGWVAFYFWFNTFAEVATFLPLLLLGIEVTIKKKQPYLLVVAVFTEAVINYFFLFSICLFGVGYALFRLFQTGKERFAKDNFKILGLGVLGFALGLTLSSFAIIPGFLTALKSPRVNSTSYLGDLVDNLKLSFSNQYIGMFNSDKTLSYFYRVQSFKYEIGDFRDLFYKSINNWNLGGSGKEYRRFYPLISFLFPTMSCRYVSLVDINYEWNLGSSLFVFTPTIMFFIISIFESYRKHKVSHFIAIGIFLIILFCPIFYAVLFGFSAQYGRWQIIAVISILIYVALNFDNRKDMPKWYFPISVLITLFLMILAYFFVRTKIYNDSISEKFNATRMNPVFIGSICFAAIEGCIFFSFWNKKYFSKIVLGFIVLEATIMGNVAQVGQGIISYKNNVNGGYNNVTKETKIFKELKKYDDSYYRVFSTRQYQGNENIQLREGYNGVGTFHSLYNYYTLDFLQMSHVFKSSNTWIGGVYEKRLNLDTFLGVKYYLTKDSDTTITYNSGRKVLLNPNIPFDYEEVLSDKVSDGYHLYQNKNHIDLGFSYDTLYNKYIYDSDEYLENISRTAFKNDGKSDMSIIAEEAYMKGAILNNSDIKLIKENNESLFVKETPIREANQLQVNYKTRYLLTTYDPLKLDQMEEGTSTDWKQQIVEITPKNGTYLNQSDNGDYFILDLKLQRSPTNYNAQVYLFTDGDEIISRDNHTAPGNTSGYKHLRGFYGQKVTKIVIAPSSKVSIPSHNPSLYSETYETYMSHINEFKSYPLENVQNDINKYTFTTNFDSERFIILQLPYEKGWTIKAINNGKKEKLNYYNAQGGFVGFVSKTAETKYIVSYKSVGFNPAIALTISSIFIFGGVIAGGAVIEHKRKEKEKQTIE